MAVLITAGCTTNNAPTQVNEKNAPKSLSSNNDQGITSRINDIKNGATPKVKPTGESNANTPPVPPQQPIPTQKSVTNYLTINEGTRNMNKAIIKTSKGEYYKIIRILQILSKGRKMVFADLNIICRFELSI